MNKHQMEMLSVKSAVERTVQGLISSYSQIPLPNPHGLYEEICRYMASLFASRQIDQDYQVERGVSGKLEITFRTQGQISSLTFMPPAHQPSPLAALAREQSTKQSVTLPRHRDADRQVLQDVTPGLHPPFEDAFDYAKKFTR